MFRSVLSWTCRITLLPCFLWTAQLAAQQPAPTTPAAAPTVAPAAAPAETPASVTPAEEKLFRQIYDDVIKLTGSYADAYSKNDPKGVASFWAETGVYVDSETGDEVKGREKIEAAYGKLFAAEKGISLSVTLQSISPNNPAHSSLTIYGTAVISQPDGTSSASNFQASLVKESTGWKIASVSEVEGVVPASNYEKLAELHWMIGQWQEESGDTKIFTRGSWTANRNFLKRSFTVMVGDEVQLAGTQVIGYDASLQAIRSWVFDTDGGFSEGIWTAGKNEEGQEQWTVKMAGVLQDGRRASAVQVITKVDENKAIFQSVSREVDGELLPSSPAVSVVRVALPAEDANSSSGDVAVPTAGSADSAVESKKEPVESK